MAAMALDTVKMSRFTLALDDPGLEREFLDEYADSVRLPLRGVLLLFIVMLLAFAGVDPAGEVGFYQRLVRYTVGGLTAPPTLALTFASARTFRRFWAAMTSVFGALNLATMPVILIVLSLRVHPCDRPPDLSVRGCVSLDGAGPGMEGTVAVGTKPGLQAEHGTPTRWKSIHPRCSQYESFR